MRDKRRREALERFNLAHTTLPMQKLVLLIAVLTTILFLLIAPAGRASASTSAQSATSSSQALAFPPVTPAMHSYSTTGYVLSFALPFWSLFVLLTVLMTGWSARMRDEAERWAPRWLIVRLGAYLVLYTLVASVINAPATWYLGYWLPHHYGLSHETAGLWLADDAKTIGVTYCERLIALWVVFLLMQRWPRNWEVRFWVVLIPVIAAGIFASPLVIDPLFNKFTPLPAGPLRTQIRSLAVKAGIPHAPILVADVSRQTDETNAYVDGIGSSARIVLWDTTLRRMPEDETLAIVGHEMGHYVLKHIYWGYLETMGFLLVVLPLVRRFYDFTVGRFGNPWRLRGPTDLAAIPVLLATMVLLNFLSAPLVNAVSRNIEHQADAYGLRVTGNRMAMARAMIDLSVQNLDEPDPPALYQFWYGSHPTLRERVDFALGRNSRGNSE
ncbi:MAG: M48 family metallopeptidase [Capsulimonadaceae bacterium]